jgi:hypothetical protein
MTEMSSARRSTSGLEHNGWSKAQTIRRLSSVLRPLAGHRRLRFSFFANEPFGGQMTDDGRQMEHKVCRPLSVLCLLNRACSSVG